MRLGPVMVTYSQGLQTSKLQGVTPRKPECYGGNMNEPNDAETLWGIAIVVRKAPAKQVLSETPEDAS